MDSTYILYLVLFVFGAVYGVDVQYEGCVWIAFSMIFHGKNTVTI